MVPRLFASCHSEHGEESHDTQDEIRTEIWAGNLLRLRSMFPTQARNLTPDRDIIGVSLRHALELEFHAGMQRGEPVSQGKVKPNLCLESCAMASPYPFWVQPGEFLNSPFCSGIRCVN